VRGWLLDCTAGTGCALGDVERALYVLDRRVGKAPKTGRNWREYADAVMDKRAAAH
jgi:hypothetical protein